MKQDAIMDKSVSLESAIQAGDIKKVRYLLQKGAKYHTVPDVYRPANIGDGNNIQLTEDQKDLNELILN